MRVDRELFQEACEILRDKVEINEYLEREGHVHYDLGEKNNMIKCPFPDHDDNTPSFSYNLKKQVFNCFGCERSGDIVNLHYYFNHIENERFTRTRAVRELARTYKIEIPNLYQKGMKTGRVNKYRRPNVNMRELPESFYVEKVKGYEKLVKKGTEDKRIEVYKVIDDMYLGNQGAKEVFEKVRRMIK